MLVGVNSTARSQERWSKPTNRLTPLDSSLPMANRANPFRICTCRAPSVTPLESAVTKKGRGYPVMVNQRNSLTRYSSGCQTCDPFVTNSGAANLPVRPRIIDADTLCPTAFHSPPVTFLSPKKPSNSTQHPIAQRFRTHTVCGCILGFQGAISHLGIKGTSGG